MEWNERAVACFKGLATGDAVGKQTETLEHTDIRKWYPDGITGFHGRPGDVIPRYIGKRYEWRIGETTDDTEQSIAVARALLSEGKPSHTAIGRELLRCRKSVHPDLSIWRFQQIGDPARIASDGNGCGAAMRAAPIGVIYPPDRLDELISGARECALPTHGGQMAILAAAAVAAAVSAAVEGFAPAEVLAAAVKACRQTDTEGALADQIERTYTDLCARKRLVPSELARECFPNATEQIVELAIGLALTTESAEETVLLAANVGGDADSVASIGGAIAGALRPNTVNERWYEVVRQVVQEDLVGFAVSLASMRGQRSDGLPSCTSG